ncbi:TRAM superfamily RNA-binding protein [Candidatus Mancarchaeum acidiphilum]|uniref:TRAM superfamily RNA-binding protein n=1 Tax=Candidatus Mancarchaeum acidiphilum TaxID=1920749 RepID=A0A218NNE9_9ARCH|nr:TRAM domain-containing protein [Candidatus Mancarchaeum acidiphilum]ASI13989.1 TRAM superfamily RNA-binding protein [Candidatus Mancarchaeum acidiphilum]
MNDEGNGNGSYEGHGGFGRRNDRFSGMSSTPKPVKVGDEIDVKIEAVASKGDGIAKKDGFVIFIKGAKEGEEKKIRITDVKERFATGEVIS